MSLMRDFRRLLVWQKAHKLCLAVFKLTDQPYWRSYRRLVGQIREAAESIPSNIVEGCGRGTDRDFAKFLHQSVGSANELEYHLLVARDRGIIQPHVFTAYEGRIVEVRKMEFGLIRQLRDNAG
jgi:four helix bundle protein